MKYIRGRPNGIAMARTYLRITLGREPTDAELDKTWGAPGSYEKQLKIVTEQDILHAYESGQEVSHIYSSSLVSPQNWTYNLCA